MGTLCTDVGMSLNVDARISGAWRKRMLFMLFMIAGSGAWFLSDGYIYWPKEAQRYQEFAEIKDALEAEGKPVDKESLELRMAWEKHAREVDYKRKFPKERTDAKVREQLVIGWSMLVGAAFFGAWVGWNHTRKVTAQGEIVIGASGDRVKIDSITKIDRRKWKNKGIAYAIYEVGGKRKRLCLDDHKFAGCEAIILEAEKRIKARSGKSVESEAESG